jgi:hypothetical protein
MDFMRKEWANLSPSDRQKVPLAQLTFHAVMPAKLKTVSERDRGVPSLGKPAWSDRDNFSKYRDVRIGRRIAK